jgi:mersacidin/lichenicidin family type 2 lantibiotic
MESVMKKFDMVRALKDNAYRAKLNASQQAAVESPAGIAELDVAVLDAIGAAGPGGSAFGFSTWCTVCQP